MDKNINIFIYILDFELLLLYEISKVRGTEVQSRYKYRITTANNIIL